MAGPVKRSVMVAGHATSISLEPVFWDALKHAAGELQLPLSALVARIDADRIAAPKPANLGSALRVWLFERASERNRPLSSSPFSRDDVTIREVPPTPVAIMEHRGDPATIPATARRFHAWRKANGVSPKTSASFVLFLSDGEPRVQSDYAIDLCVEVEQPVRADDADVKGGIIPGGRCAVLRVDGASNNHRPAVLYLRREWLPGSGEEERDFPPYCRRQFVSTPDDAGNEVFAELFLPLK